MSPSTLLSRALPFLIILGCENSFEPIQKSDRSFSVFGHLDASADTQWIRVMPLRPLIFTSPEAFGTRITVEEIGSGRILVFRDSVFEYPHNVHVGSDGVFVHNFWTTERIRPGEVYRFSARASSGDSTTATITIPSDFAVTVALDTRPGTINEPANDSRPDELRVSGVENLAFVRVLALVRNLCRRGIQVLPYAIPRASSDPHGVLVRKIAGFPDRLEACGRNIVEKRDLWIVGSVSPWPVGQEFSSEALGVSERYSNLSNAVGFIGGVLTKVVPYEDCSFAGPPPLPASCVLSYDAQKAMLSGTIRDACGNRPLSEATVRLETIPADPNALRTIRTARSGLFGEYRIAALDPGVGYALSVTHHSDGSGAPGPPAYREHSASLRFSPGELVTRDIQLERMNAC